MAKLSTFCMISFLLLLTLTCASSRPMSTPYHDVTPMEHSKDKATAKVEVDDRCEGLGEEECLMRRTLEAHLDYIYTQRHKQP
uniref:Phytosulfokine n=1 Tax=Nicotiana sylvestris TaxID=4096 RepID=A0A1U7YUJ9_NICSY|nr:PREDICTED: phytosulfokines-like [Nicotiana sylvestris]